MTAADSVHPGGTFGPADREAPRQSRWIRTLRAAASPRVRLVCLPHAGGAAGFFRDWAEVLTPDADLWGIQYPGRENRIAEPFVSELHLLARDIAEELRRHNDLPTALFGHSMGAAVAFEVTRRLTAAGGQHAVRHLVVSGCAAPHRVRPFSGHESARSLGDDELVAMLRRLGADVTVLDDPEMRSVLLPPVRNDYGLIQSYAGRRDPPVPVDVTAFAGREDDAVDGEDLRAWEEVTEGNCEIRAFPGGHFYLAQHRDEVVKALDDVLSGLVDDDAPHTDRPIRDDVTEAEAHAEPKLAGAG